jgi:hypothetical protein
VRRDALAAVIAAACGACTPGIYHAPVRQPNYYSVGSDGARSLQYSQINEWVTYGTDGLGAQARVAATKKTRAGAAGRDRRPNALLPLESRSTTALHDRARRAAWWGGS